MVLYEVKAPWLLKLFVGLGYLGLLIAIVAGREYSVAGLWESGNAVALAGFVFTVLVLPYYVLVTLLTKTSFTDSEIIQRNFLMLRSTKRYEDIERVEITGRSDVKLLFTDGTIVKILTGEWYLQKTLKILKEQLDLRGRDIS